MIDLKVTIIKKSKNKFYLSKSWWAGWVAYCFMENFFLKNFYPETNSDEPLQSPFNLKKLQMMFDQ